MAIKDKPVMLPPGRARLVDKTSLHRVGRMRDDNRYRGCRILDGLNDWSGRDNDDDRVKWTSSFASAGRRSNRPAPHRYSMVTSWPSLYPSS